MNESLITPANLAAAFREGRPAAEVSMESAEDGRRRDRIVDSALTVAAVSSLVAGLTYAITNFLAF